MCGRARQALSAVTMHDAAIQQAGVPRQRAWKARGAFHPTENLCPGRTAAVVALREDGAEIVTMRWGLVPPYEKGKPDFWKMFNARSETLSTSPVFSRCLQQRRCAVPLDGFFECTARRWSRLTALLSSTSPALLTGSRFEPSCSGQGVRTSARQSRPNSRGTSRVGRASRCGWRGCTPTRAVAATAVPTSWRRELRRWPRLRRSRSSRETSTRR